MLRHGAHAPNNGVAYDVVVSGAGIVGAAAARGLELLSKTQQQAKKREHELHHPNPTGTLPSENPPILRTLLVDRSPPPSFDNDNSFNKLRTVAMTPMSSRILNNLGAWSLLQNKHGFHRMAIRHEKQNESLVSRLPGASFFMNSVAEAKAESLPPVLEFMDLDAPLGYICCNDELQAALTTQVAAERLEQPPVDGENQDADKAAESAANSVGPSPLDLCFLTELQQVAVPPKGSIAPVKASMSSKQPAGATEGKAGEPSSTPLHTSLLLGCEGRGGEGLAQLVASPSIERDYAQFAFVATVVLENLCDGNVCAFQNFFGDGRIIGFLPMSENTANLVYSTTKAEAIRLQNAEKDDLLKHLNSLLHDIAPRDIPRIVDCTASPDGKKLARGMFPLKLRVNTTPFTNRLIMLGDAAHAIHPMAGQGLNLGLYDIGALIDEIQHALNHGEDIGSEGVLQRVSSRMFQQTAPIISATEAVKITATQLPTIACSGMHLLNSIPLVKEKGIQYVASGQHLYNASSLLFS